MTDNAPRLPSPSRVVARFKQGERTYEQRFNSCGNPACKRCRPGYLGTPGHGPYWYLCVRVGSRWRRVYLGKDCDTTKYITPEGEIDSVLLKDKAAARMSIPVRCLASPTLHFDQRPFAPATTNSTEDPAEQPSA